MRLLTLPTVALLCLLPGLSAAWAAPAPAEIVELLQQTAPLPAPARIEAVSAHFLGRPYVLGPLGEGSDGKYDRDPLYRFDVFDCTTYVETQLALSISGDFGAFEGNLAAIRYLNGVISYPTRNHFTDADWIPNNVAAGFLEDITGQVAAPERPRIATALVDKPAWYLKMPLETIQAPGLSDAERELLLEDLHREGRNFRPEEVSVPYVHLDSIFPPEGVNRALLDRIPSGAILNIVRPDWDLVATTGTHQNISHQALVIRKDGVPYMRHATPTQHAVVDVPLEDYLRKLLTSPTVRGINLLKSRR